MTLCRIGVRRDNINYRIAEARWPVELELEPVTILIGSPQPETSAALFRTLENR